MLGIERYLGIFTMFFFLSLYYRTVVDRQSKVVMFVIDKQNEKYGQIVKFATEKLHLYSLFPYVK